MSAPVAGVMIVAEFSVQPGKAPQVLEWFARSQDSAHAALAALLAGPARVRYLDVVEF